MKKLVCGLLALLLMMGTSLAEEGRVRASIKLEKMSVAAMLQDTWHKESCRLKAGQRLSVRAQQTCQGVQVAFHQDRSHIIIRAEDETILAEYDGNFRIAYIPFSAPAAIFSIEAQADLGINDVQPVAEGEIPRWVQQWRPLSEDADMLIVATHPDDELLWFGGLIPTYAGQKGKKVIVLYMTGGLDPTRACEALDGLWTCGVRDYPDIGTLEDRGAISQDATYSYWGGQDAVTARIVRAIRQYRPKVVVTQDVNGEYGHSHHIVTSRAVRDAVALSGDASFDQESAEEFGVYTPMKTYIHMLQENPVVYDFLQPLPAFDGKTGVDMAKKALKMHASQTQGRYHVAVGNKYDCQHYGLYQATVGVDEEKKDMFEHIPQ